MENEKKTSRKVVRVILRVLYVVLVLLAFVVILLLGAIYAFVKGPSEEAKSLFVQSLNETSAAKWVPRIFLSEEEVKSLLPDAREGGYEVDPTSVKVRYKGTYVKHDTKKTEGSGTPDDNTPDPEFKDIELINVNGSTYKGTLMLIRDPSRVVVGTPERYGSDQYGLSLHNMCLRYGAVGGINAGGFYDVNGTGTGADGAPVYELDRAPTRNEAVTMLVRLLGKEEEALDGIVIKEGKLMWGSPGTVSTVIGFDKNDILRVGWMSAQNALDLGMRDACSFGPALIVNGRALNEKNKLGGGVNPRTAIGQREDGTVMLLVIDGRSTSSLGVTYDDLVDIMLSYGAVNAANLDGGSSTLMEYEGKTVNSSAYLFGERILATAWLVI